MAPININGDEPPIVGSTCEALVVVELHRAGSIVEPANVIFLKFAGAWHRLYFDHEIVFWRTDHAGPAGFVDDGPDADFRPVDLGSQRGLCGLTLLAVVYERLPAGSAVRLELEHGRSLTFRCLDDVTSYT